jgi:hypothetical protein
MKYDMYGRFQLEVLRENGAWKVYHIGQGVKSLAHDVVLPHDLAADEVAIFLDDLFHESDTSGRGINELQ